MWNGWLFVADAHWQLVNEAELRALSAGTRLLRLAVEEHVMFAEAASWCDGEEEWAVTGDEHASEPALATRGRVPDELLQFGDRESESGLFGVPVLMIENLTGWRYDATNAELDAAAYWPILGLRPATQSAAAPGRRALPPYSGQPIVFSATRTCTTPSPSDGGVEFAAADVAPKYRD